MNEVIYPDGSREKITEELLERGSELQRKNVPLPYLRLVVSKPREWKGTMGVTSVLNGKRFNYLKYKMQPDFNLDDSAFLALGISSHNMLDENTADKDSSEEWLTDGRVVGRSDLLEVEPGEDKDSNILNDYKVSGSFKVARSVGIVEGPRVPAVDEFGYPILYKRSGKGYKAGDQKMDKSWVIKPETADNWEYEMQLNKYRRMYEKKGIKISKMRIFFIVRDGGTRIAKSYGVDKKIYLLEIPFLPDEEVDKYYDEYTEEFSAIMEDTKDISGTPEEVVKETLRAGINIPICNIRENWAGRKCEGYCAYSAACKLFGDNPYLGRSNENEDGSSNTDF